MKRSHIKSSLLLIVLGIALLLYSFLLPGVMPGLRVDMTENKQYTISSGSREILANLPQKITLKLYYSESTSRELPQLRQYADEVWNFLQEMSQYANGMLVLEKIDPEPFSVAEEDALMLGLQAVPAGTAKSLFLGLVATNELDGLQLMPFLQPDKAVFLEYDLARMISGLAQPVQQKVAWLSPLPVMPGIDPATGQAHVGWEVYKQLQQIYQLTPVSIKATELPEDIGLLIIAAVDNLSAELVFQIEQFVLGGGRLLLFLDPLSERATTAESTHLSGLESLLAGWGIEYDSSQVIGDQQYALQVSISPELPPQRHLAILGLPAAAMSQADVITADLEVINVSSAGFLKSAPAAALTSAPLLFSSNKAGQLSATQVAGIESPDELVESFVSTGEQYVLAARYSGSPQRVLPIPEGFDEGVIEQADTQVQIVVVADSDLLDDRFWVRHQAFFEQTVSTAFADNGNFLINAVDNLLGSHELISIRTRNVTHRPFTRVEQLRLSAEAELHDKERQLQQQLQLIEDRLQQLQALDSEAARISPEQQAEVQLYIEQRLTARRQLRQVQQSLNQEIRALGTKLKVINILLVPALVVVFSTLYFWWRRRRGQSS